VPTEDGTRAAIHITDSDGNSIGKPSKWGSQRIMFVGKSEKMFIRMEHSVRDDTMTGTEKQTMYVTPLNGNADSEHAVEQLLQLYSIPSWSAAVGNCKQHGIVGSMKSKNPTPKQITDHATALATRGGVFFPTSTNDIDDEDRCLKFSGKLVQARKQHVPASGTGFDVPAVNRYFEENNDAGLRLIEFLGRDGHAYTGQHGDIQSVGTGLFILTLHPDYYAAKISKVTTPHRLETVVCIDVQTASNGSQKFTMPNIQAMLETPDSDEEGVLADVDAFVAKRRKLSV
jgi:hypothetical protein